MSQGGFMFGFAVVFFVALGLALAGVVLLAVWWRKRRPAGRGFEVIPKAGEDRERD